MAQAPAKKSKKRTVWVVETAQGGGGDIDEDDDLEEGSCHGTTIHLNEEPPQVLNVKTLILVMELFSFVISMVFYITEGDSPSPFRAFILTVWSRIFAHAVVAYSKGSDPSRESQFAKADYSDVHRISDCICIAKAFTWRSVLMPNLFWCFMTFGFIVASLLFYDGSSLSLVWRLYLQAREACEPRLQSLKKIVGV